MRDNVLNNLTVLENGKFTILKVLGRGGFGVTYLARQNLLQKQVAIKEFYLQDLCARDDTGFVTTLTQGEMVDCYRQKFFKEARILSRLSHPGIVRVTDIFEENNTVYYVMDYVEGVSLSEMVMRNGSLSEGIALRYIYRVAEALNYLHQSGINHLDVKPSNIMVRQKDDMPILIDFGLSKQYDGQKNQTTSSPPGVSNGYSPLEQYKFGGVSTFSPQADIYSLGATLFKLLTGETPPNANDILNDCFPSMPETITLQTRRAIEKAMQPRRNDRPDSVMDFIRMLGMDNLVEEDVSPNIGSRDADAFNEDTQIVDAVDAKEEQTIGESTRFSPTDDFKSLQGETKKQVENIGLGLSQQVPTKLSALLSSVIEKKWSWFYWLFFPTFFCMMGERSSKKFYFSFLFHPLSLYIMSCWLLPNPLLSHESLPLVSYATIILLLINFIGGTFFNFYATRIMIKQIGVKKFAPIIMSILSFFTFGFIFFYFTILSFIVSLFFILAYKCFSHKWCVKNYNNLFSVTYYTLLGISFFLILLSFWYVISDFS